MSISCTRVSAQVSVADHTRAVGWYSELFDNQPTTTPMDGLAEWKLTDTGSLQVFADTAIAGSSTVAIGVANLEEFAHRLGEIEFSQTTTPRGQRLATVIDPDANTIVVAQDL